MSLYYESRFVLSNRDSGRLDLLDDTDVIRAKLALNQDATRSPWILSGEISDPRLRRHVDYLIPEIRITEDDGTGSDWTPLGLHRVTQTPKSHPTTGSTGSFTCEDLTAVVARLQLTNDVTVTAGTDVRNFIYYTLVTTLGFQPRQVVLPPITKTPSLDLPYYTGDSWLKLFDDALNAVGFRGLYMDASGALTTSESVELTAQTAVVTYDNATVIGAPTEDHDDSRIKNIQTVRRITPGSPVISYTASNTDPSSPLYIRGPIGMLAAPPIDEPALADLATAETKAKAELSYGASFYNKATVKVVPDTRIGLYQVIALDVRDVDGNVQIAGNWLRRTLDVPLGPGARDLAQGMTMGLNRTQPFEIGGGLNG